MIVQSTSRYEVLCMVADSANLLHSAADVVRLPRRREARQTLPDLVHRRRRKKRWQFGVETQHLAAVLDPQEGQRLLNTSRR